MREPRLAFPARPVVWCLVLATALLASVALRAEESPYAVEPQVSIPMRDGVKLVASIFRPHGDGKHPTILLRTPYGRHAGGHGEAPRYTAAGYAMVVQDCRGRGDSEGVWEPFLHDPADGFDTQEWIGRQPWSDGKIGTAGGSYGGWTQWASAADASSHLRAMVPVVPFADAYEIAYTGGAFQLALLGGWGAAVGGVSLDPAGIVSAFRFLPLERWGDQFQPAVPYINEWVRHPEYDEFWRARGIGGRHDAVTVPVLNIGGWYDIFSKATVEWTDKVRAESRDPAARRNQLVIMGPWAHGVGARQVGELDFGESARLGIGDLQFEWFEHWLRGRRTEVPDWPAYRIFVMGENVWRGEHEWPLARTKLTRFHLRSAGSARSVAGDGRLSLEPPASEPADSFVHDPARPVPTVGGNNLIGALPGPFDQALVEGREDVLVYSSAPLEEELEVTGPVTMVLWAATSATDTDFTAKLCDVHPDGRSFNLCDGIVRAMYRDGRGKPPRWLEPGELVRYEIDLWVTSNLFRRGHRVRVQIASSSFPRFDRNPSTGAPFGRGKELSKATQTVHHDTEHASYLLLPVIPR